MRRVLKGLSDASVDALVTDPPAGIEFMGKKWDHHRDAPLLNRFKGEDHAMSERIAGLLITGPEEKLPVERPVVMDPFSGSGTAGVVALKLGRDYLGIELNPAYVAMSVRRIEGDSPLTNRRQDEPPPPRLAGGEAAR